MNPTTAQSQEIQISGASSGGANSIDSLANRLEAVKITTPITAAEKITSLLPSFLPQELQRLVVDYVVITINVKLLTGGRTLSVTVVDGETVGDLKQKIFKSGQGARTSQKQNLLAMGKLLQPDTSYLYDHNLRPGSMVFVSAAVRG